MKVLFIGDIHGRTDWITYAEDAVKNGKHVVFLGDYVDSFIYGGHHIIDNLQRIIAFKKKQDHRRIKNSNKPTVTLLLGNHDYAYMMGKIATKGYNGPFAEVYRQLFSDNWDLFDLAWGYKNEESGVYTLATHAGITNTWWDNSVMSYSGFIEKIIETPWTTKNMHEVLNILKDKFSILWEIGEVRGGFGDPGIIWADISELVADPYPNINQIVGHSAYGEIEIFYNKNGTIITKIDGLRKESNLITINL